MNRLNRILTAALAVQVVLAVVVFLPRIIPTSAESAPLFGALSAADITGLTLKDQEGNQIELAKQGDAWSLPEHANYPADNTKVGDFLGKMLGLKTDTLVARTNASHKQLQVAVDDFVRQVDLKLADGSSRTVYLGSAASGGATHVRLGDRDEVYVGRGVSSFDVNATIGGWIDTTYLSLDRTQIVQMTLENANGAFEFEQGDSDVWALTDLAADETMNSENVSMLALRIASVPMLRPLGKEAQPEYGLDQPSAVVTATTRDDAGAEKTYTLTIGAKDDAEDSYVVKSSESEWYARATSFSVEEFVTRTRQDFLQAPATPTPMSTPAITSTLEVTSTLEITPTLEATP
ncbi:MAG TPA: DUF4340 domain-containing protein [Anaerolineae bacterium]|nr:DUF4340 domain-containing protein [Anaerolineae bacterium]